jgi:hypothetical protein
MTEETYNDLQGIRHGQESGAVLYADGEILICNWTANTGNSAHVCNTGLIGMGETLKGYSFAHHTTQWQGERDTLESVDRRRSHDALRRPTRTRHEPKRTGKTPK